MKYSIIALYAFWLFEVLLHKLTERKTQVSLLNVN
jgi:hypothetical protein